MTTNHNSCPQDGACHHSRRQLWRRDSRADRSGHPHAACGVFQMATSPHPRTTSSGPPLPLRGTLPPRMTTSTWRLRSGLTALPTTQPHCCCRQPPRRRRQRTGTRNTSGTKRPTQASEAAATMGRAAPGTARAAASPQRARPRLQSWGSSRQSSFVNGARQLAGWGKSTRTTKAFARTPLTPPR